MLLGKEYICSFLSRAIKLATRQGFEAEGYYFGEELRAMRSARPGVHQTSVSREGELWLRLRRGLRSVEAAVSSPAEIGSVLHQAREMMGSARPNPLLYQLSHQPKVLPEETLGLQKIPDQFWEDLPVKQAAFRAIRQAESQTPDWRGAGNFLAAAHEMGVANSEGLLRYTTGCYCGFTVVASGGKRARGLTAYADGFSRLPQELDYQDVVSHAFDNARLTDQLPLYQPLHGRWRIQMDAVLSPNCVADWISDAAMAFSGYLIHTGESYVSERTLGKSRIAGSSITLRDDWQDSRSLALPFDLEGRTRQSVALIDQGVYAGRVYDGMSAKLAKQKPTGHSGAELGTDVPDILVLEGQKHTLQDLIAACDKPALLLTWPHYSSDMYQKEGMWTVTGHHGVFLAKGGRLVGVCPPTRIRMRSFDALRRVELMTASTPIFDVERYPLTFPTSSVVPWVKIRGVEFINS